MITKRNLGKTGIQVSEMGFGSWAIGGNSYGSVNDQESLIVLQKAMDEGITFFDTADVYGMGHSEELIGQVIQNHRQEVVLATKAGWDFYQGMIKRNFNPVYLREALDKSLRRLRTDYIDLFQLHNPKPDLIRDGAVIEFLRDMKKRGKIRAYGVSVHGPEEGIDWIKNTDVETVQIAFNLLDQRMADDFLDLAVQLGRGVIAREPLACGILSGKYNMGTVFPKDDHRRRWPEEKLRMDMEKISKIKKLSGFPQKDLAGVALEFVLFFEGVSTMIPGIKRVEQLENNLRSLKEKHLDHEMISRIHTLYQSDELFAKGLYKN